MPEPDGVDTLDKLMNDARPDTLPAVLDAAKGSVLELLTGAPVPPSTVRVAVGPVTIEMDWPARGSQDGPEQPPGGFVSTRPDAQAEHGTAIDHIHATTVGVFYRASEPGARPFVSEGDTVAPGQQVGIIEAMKLMIPVEADRHGTIDKFLQNNGALVEYGEPLCSLVPATGE